jgi:peptidoglycan/LPS O-acetylase OafA/YrhL
LASKTPTLRTIESLQAGRGLAALAVAVHHSAQTARLLGQVSYKPLELGYLGVDFFFVLSGFIIFHSTVGRDRKPKQYAIARFRRVYLPYWPVGIGVALLFVEFPGVSALSRSAAWEWLPTITLMPVDGVTALTVAWTLKHEILFYALFGILYYSRMLWLGLPIWVLAILIWGAPIRTGHVAFDPINIEFLFGIGACLLYRRGLAHPLLVIGAVVSVALFALAKNELLMGLAFAFLIAPIAQLEDRGHFRVPIFLTLLGAASYSLYLVHYPLVSAASRIHFPVLISGVFVSVIGGFCYHFAVERQVIKARWNPEVFDIRRWCPERVK